MICHPPSSFTPCLSTQNAELTLFPTATREPCETFNPPTCNRSIISLEWRQSKSDPTSLQIVKEQSVCQELPLNAEEHFGANMEILKLNMAKECHHRAQEGEEDVRVEERIIDIESNHHSSQAGAVKDITLGALLKVCSEQKDLLHGIRIHAEIIKYGLFEKNIFLGSSLVNLYAKCSAFEVAERVFDELPVRSIVAWNSLIGGYAQHLHAEKALSFYFLMQQEGFIPNTITFLSVLKACGSIDMLDQSQVIHGHVVKTGLLEDTRVSTALVDMYAKSGALEKAQRVFSSLIVRDVVAWTVLILGYAEHEFGEEALQCYEKMYLDRLTPDAVTLACILKACGSIGVAYEGQKIHAELVSCEILEKDMVAGSALVDMYANCGMLAEAQEVFDSLHIKNVVAWSALMEGHAQLGEDEIVFGLFERMIRSGSKPTLVTFTILLNACCHRGLLNKGMVFFERLTEEHGMVPTIEHYACMVDLFCRAGHLDKAIVMIREMSESANLVIWKTLLEACQKWGNTKLGRWTFSRVVVLNETDAAAYVCLSNFTARRQIAYKVKSMR